MRLEQLHVFYQGSLGVWIIGAARQACSVRVRSEIFIYSDVLLV